VCDVLLLGRRGKSAPSRAPLKREKESVAHNPSLRTKKKRRIRRLLKGGEKKRPGRPDVDDVTQSRRLYRGKGGRPRGGWWNRRCSLWRKKRARASGVSPGSTGKKKGVQHGIFAKKRGRRDGIEDRWCRANAWKGEALCSFEQRWGKEKGKSVGFRPEGILGVGGKMITEVLDGERRMVSVNAICEGRGAWRWLGDGNVVGGRHRKRRAVFCPGVKSVVIRRVKEKTCSVVKKRLMALVGAGEKGRERKGF